MGEQKTTHFLTDLGPLCGALPPHQWTLSPHATTCWACRALLDAGIRQRRPSTREAPLGVVPIGRLRGG